MKGPMDPGPSRPPVAHTVAEFFQVKETQEAPATVLSATPNTSLASLAQQPINNPKPDTTCAFLAQ